MVGYILPARATEEIKLKRKTNKERKKQREEKTRSFTNPMPKSKQSHAANSLESKGEDDK